MRLSEGSLLTQPFDTWLRNKIPDPCHASWIPAYAGMTDEEAPAVSAHSRRVVSPMGRALLCHYSGADKLLCVFCASL